MKIYLKINNVQQGSYDLSVLQQMMQNGQLTR
jgi:hypothetical protein